MREIKFRAWDKLEKKMTMSQSLKEMLITDSIPSAFFEDQIWMQYTGIKDKNGVEIYQGDIVLYKNSVEKGIAEIKEIWETSNLAFWWIEQETKSPTMFNEINYFRCAEELKVIGNVYKTPELLERA